MPSVLQPWVQDLTLMQQSVLLGSIRGPDGVKKYHPVKPLLRWYRRCVLISALDGLIIDNPAKEGGGSFTGPSIFNKQDVGLLDKQIVGNWETYMDLEVSKYLQTVDELPHHFQMHLMHSIEILGYKHPNERIRTWWYELYLVLVNDLHLQPETENELDRRLGDNREEWLKRTHPSVVK